MAVINHFEEILRISCIAVFAGGYLNWSALKRMKRVRQIEDHPLSKVETAAQGLTELQGFAWTKEESPKSSNGRHLVYYGFELQKLVREGSGKNRRAQWRTVYSGGYKEPFYIVDATGLAIVDPATAELNFRNTKEKAWNALSEEVKNHYLENVIKGDVLDFPPSEFFFGLFGHRFRILETEVNEGAPLYLQGDFRSDKDSCYKTSRPGLSEFKKRFLNGQSRKIRDVKALLDLNKDGKVSYREMIEGYTRYASFIRKKSEAEKMDEATVSVFGIVRTSENHQLLLADTHEQQLLESFGSWNLLRLTFGLIFLSSGIFGLLLSLGQIHF